MPVAVSAKSVLPAATAAGEMAVSVNPPPPVPLPVIESVSVPEVVLSDFITRMLTVPAAAICAAETCAVSWVDELTVVGSEVPSHRMVVPCAKFVPVAVRVKPAPPAAIVVGLMDESVGASTPLKPPHPHTITERTKNNKETGE